MYEIPVRGRSVSLPSALPNLSKASKSTKIVSTTAIAITKIARNVYSRLRKAAAPSCMDCPMLRIVSSPSSSESRARVVIEAKTKPTILAAIAK